MVLEGQGKALEGRGKAGSHMSIDDSSIDRFTASSGVATTWCQSYWFRISDLESALRQRTHARTHITHITHLITPALKPGRAQATAESHGDCRCVSVRACVSPVGDQHAVKAHLVAEQLGEVAARGGHRLAINVGVCIHRSAAASVEGRLKRRPEVPS